MSVLSLKAILLLLVSSLMAANSSTDYQVIAYFRNAPVGAEAAAISATQSLFDLVSQYFLNCEFLEPGEKYVLRRELEAEGSEGDESLSSHLRGSSSRHLQVSSCPSSCSSSGSTRCKSMGCAFCGRCRRERKLQTSFNVSSTAAISFGSASTTAYGNGTTVSSSSSYSGVGATSALIIEGLFRSKLQTYCNGASNCAIWAKILRVLNNGTTYPVTG